MQATQKKTVQKGVRMVRKALFFLLLFVVVDVIAGFVIGQYATLSAVAWSDFRSAENPCTVFVGSSFAERGFDAIAYDEERCASGASDTGLSYNIATSGQTLSMSFDSIDDAINAGVKRIVLGVGCESFRSVEYPRSDIPYLLARYEDRPLELLRQLADVALQPHIIGTKDSLNVLFPWVFDAETSRSLIDNVRERLAGESRGKAAEKIIDHWYYKGRGYGNYDYTLKEDDKRTSTSCYGAIVPDEGTFVLFEQICQKCHDAGVDLVVVSTPHPDYDIASEGDAYNTIMARVQKTAQDRGATFFDFNRVIPQAMSLQREDFCDFEHLNLSGAEKFTRAFARVLTRYEAGEDTSTCFASNEAGEVIE